MSNAIYPTTSRPINLSIQSPSLGELPPELIQKIALYVLGDGSEGEAIKNHLTFVEIFRQASTDGRIARLKARDALRSPTSPFYHSSVLKQFLPSMMQEEAIEILYPSNTSSKLNNHNFQVTFYQFINAFRGVKALKFPVANLPKNRFPSDSTLADVFNHWQGKVEHVEDMIGYEFKGLAIQALKNYPLHQAALTGDLDRIKLLLSKNHSITAVLKGSRLTPFDLVAYSGNPKATELFFKHATLSQQHP